MKFLFIYPNALKAIQEQLGIAYLAGQLERDGVEVRLHDCTFDSKEQLGRTISEWKPDYVGLSLWSNELVQARKIYEFVKSRTEATIIVGGPHATLCKEEAIFYGDYVLTGEADWSVVDLVNGRVPKGFYHPNFYYEPPIAPNLDIIAFPKHELFVRHFKKEFFGRSGVLGMFLTSRGCPYSCSYCSNAKLKRLHACEPNGWTRFRRPSDVAKEIALSIEKFDITHFYLADDTATLKKAHILRLCDKFEQFHLPWYAMARCDTVNSEVFEAMKNAGCEMVLMGIECGDEYIRRTVLNRKMSNEMILNAFHNAKKAGIKTIAFNMTGIPGEGEGEFLKTLALNKECEVDDAKMTILCAIPGTKMWGMMKRQGMLEGDMPVNYYEKSNIKLYNVNSDELLKRQERFYKEIRER